MSARVAVLLLTISLHAGMTADARAQDTVTDVVSFLMITRVVPTGDFERDQEAAAMAAEAVTRALIVNLTSVPIATSSSGFLYRLNPLLGTVERATDSFGAFFIERALAPGHGRASFGLSASTSRFDELDGQSLDDGTFLTTANRFVDEAAPFDTETLTLRVRTSTVTAFASVGVTERLEIGGALPFVRLTLEGERVNTYYGDRSPQASGAAIATGVADAALRAKYTIHSARRAGVAVAAELRIPTGNEANLLGSGATGFRILGIGAVERGPVMLAGNAGIIRGGISDELNLGGAAALAVRPRLSLTAELLIRNIAQLRPLELSSQPHPTIADVHTLRLVGGEPGRTIAGGVAGLKWNPTGTIVVGGHVRWHFTTAGLTAPITPSLAIEYGF
ncbi:MAG: hypothetical protein M3253_05485 [Chloroflexota bacterium]|nr:hypothetical protein [Chloroflexota bacterium]